MPLRNSLSSLLVVVGLAWSALGLPLRPSETLAYRHRFGTSRIMSISRLQEGEVLTARYWSSGCYHLITARMSFRRNDAGGIDVQVVAQDGLLRDAGMFKQELTDYRVVALDGALLHFRAQGWRGRCTTKVRIHLSLHRHGRYLGHERVEDLGCLGFWPPLSFEHLVDEALATSLW